LDNAFLSATPDDGVLFEVAVTKAWLRQVIVGLTLICRSPYRGVVEFLRDLLGLPVSLGCVHDVLEAATRQASAINHDQDLSRIRVGLHDEIFQGAEPVLAGVDAQSTYCYLLAAERHRDAGTWGMHLLDAAQQELQPDDTIADAGQGLRAGQKAAWGDTPCHGDVFHIQRRCEGLATTLARLAKGATSRRQTLQATGSAAPASGVQTTSSPSRWRLPGRPRPRRMGWPATSERSPSGGAMTFWPWPARPWPPGESCSTSSSRSWRAASPGMPNASARCALRCRTRATPCSLSPACSTTSWPTSRKPMPSPSPSCVTRACCTACPAPRPRIGRDGTG